jgi:hypothetical protein
MENGARSRRSARRRGCRRNRRLNQVGGAGEAYTLGPFVAGAPVINNYGQEIVRFPSCEEATRPGYISGAASAIRGGLPGFSGGGRKSRRVSSCASRSRRGRRMMYGGSDSMFATGSPIVVAAETQEGPTMSRMNVANQIVSAPQSGGAGYTPGNPYPQTYLNGMTTTYSPPADGPKDVIEPVPGASDTVPLARQLATAKVGGSVSGVDFFRGGVLETGADQLAGQMGGRKGRKGRKTRKGECRRRKSRRQTGGRYGFDTSVVGAAGIAIPGRPYTGCGTGLEAIQNPLVKGDFPGPYITAPPPTEAAYNGQFAGLLKGGRRRRAQSGGVGGVDSMFYNAPRTGYTFYPSDSQGGNGGTLSDGQTAYALRVPFSAMPTPSPACLKTGGRRRTRKGRKGRKSRKGRKGSRRA